MADGAPGAFREVPVAFCGGLPSEMNLSDLGSFTSLQSSGNVAAARVYTWNAENRLVAVTPAAGAETAESVKVTFAYDYRGRRIEKIVYDYDWDEPNEVWVVTPAVHRTFVYAGWQPLLELDVDPADPNDWTVFRSYTWGPDVSSQWGGWTSGLSAAGGIGGLLALADPDDPSDPNDLFGEFVVFYDASGNVGQLVNLDPNDPNDPNTSIAAHYEYDPFGNLLAAAGPYADENPFRFSTKPLDPETGLYNFGQRYYRPDIGRWLNRDPLEELGGVNLYAYVANDPLNKIDPLGTMWIPCHGPNCGGGGGGDDPTKPADTQQPSKLPDGPDCSDCWQTCISAAGQAALGSDHGGVVCRPDGCRCACLNSRKYPGGSRGSPEEIEQRCALQHEEEHVDQWTGGRSWCRPCKPAPGGLKRQRTREICLPDNDECKGYAKEIECYAGALRNDECVDERCVRTIRMALLMAAINACSEHGCRESNVSQYSDILPEEFIDRLKDECSPWPAAEELPRGWPDNIDAIGWM